MNTFYQFIVTQWLKGKATKEAIHFILQKAHGTENGNQCFKKIEPTLDEFAGTITH